MALFDNAATCLSNYRKLPTSQEFPTPVIRSVSDNERRLKTCAAVSDASHDAFTDSPGDSSEFLPVDRV